MSSNRYCRCAVPLEWVCLLLITEDFNKRDPGKSHTEDVYKTNGDVWKINYVQTMGEPREVLGLHRKDSCVCVGRYPHSNRGPVTKETMGPRLLSQRKSLWSPVAIIKSWTKEGPWLQVFTHLCVCVLCSPSTNHIEVKSVKRPNISLWNELNVFIGYIDIMTDMSPNI